MTSSAGDGESQPMLQDPFCSEDVSDQYVCGTYSMACVPGSAEFSCIARLCTGMFDTLVPTVAGCEQATPRRIHYFLSGPDPHIDVTDMANDTHSARSVQYEFSHACDVTFCRAGTGVSAVSGCISGFVLRLTTHSGILLR
jgi:hypothetical protein